MLSFEIKREGKSIEIDCDQAGLEVLIATLQSLRNTATHVHLTTRKHLSERTPTGNPAASEVIISTGGD
jgi:hypothetical protein